MKTYNLRYAFLALVVFGCSTSDDGLGDGKGDEKNETVAYTIVLEGDSQLSGTLLNADAKSLEISSDKSGFLSVDKPQLTFEDASVLSMFRKTADCSGKITVHDFNADASTEYVVFDEEPNCNLEANALAHFGNVIFIAYEIEIAPKESDYFVRIIDVSETENNHVDIEIEQKPVDLAFANNRLFILTFDENVSEDYKLLVMNKNTFDVLPGLELGVDVKRIFTNPEGNIIIGYPDLHTTLNSATMAYEYTNYGEHTEPNFFYSRFRQFDTTGKMYYDMPPGKNSIFPVVAAIYDFEKNSTVLYAYENFLTETQLNFEFEIQSTTTVGYDEKNDLLLIGYSKASGEAKGGLLRIKLGQEPELVDNLNLDGIPYAIYTK